MAKKSLQRVLMGTADANIRFHELRELLKQLGFSEKIKGSHHIFTMTGIPAILNIQALGANAKPYQVRQVREVILRYRLAGEEE